LALKISFYAVLWELLLVNLGCDTGEILKKTQLDTNIHFKVVDAQKIRKARLNFKIIS
jgi:hypothetical protein